jgi:hypothetical protein
MSAAHGRVAAITSRLGPVDVLVLNATGPQPDGPVTEVSWADHLAQLDFFVRSPVLRMPISPPCPQGGWAPPPISRTPSASSWFRRTERVALRAAC